MGKKSTNTEVEERVNTVYQLLLESHSRFEIVQYGAENWGVQARQVDKYLARARQLIAADSEIKREEWLASAVSRLVQYEKRAGRNDNLMVAMKALETQAKLLQFDI